MLNGGKMLIEICIILFGLSLVAWMASKLTKLAMKQKDLFPDFFVDHQAWLMQKNLLNNTKFALASEEDLSNKLEDLSNKLYDAFSIIKTDHQKAFALWREYKNKLEEVVIKETSVFNQRPPEEQIEEMKNRINRPLSPGFHGNFDLVFYHGEIDSLILHFQAYHLYKLEIYKNALSFCELSLGLYKRNGYTFLLKAFILNKLGHEDLAFAYTKKAANNGCEIAKDMVVAYKSSKMEKL